MRNDAQRVEQILSELASLRQTIDSLTAEDDEQGRLDDLRLEAERMEAALNSRGVGIYEWDVRSGRIIWNERLHEILGMPSGTSFSADISELLDRIHPQDLASATAALNAHFERSEPYITTIRFRRDDGQYLSVSSVGHAIRDTNGRPIAFICSISDVAGDEDVRESDEDFDDTESSDSSQFQSHFVITRDGEFVEAAYSLCVVLGYSESSLLQLNLRDISQSEEANHFIDELVNSGGSYSSILALRASNGSYAEFSLACSRLSDGNYLCTVFSVSEADVDANADSSNGWWSRFGEVARNAAKDVARFLDSSFREGSVLAALLVAWPYLLFLTAHVFGAIAFFLIENNGQNGWNIVPADDTWISLTYARNFADTFVFSYNPGQSEAGMTSPLWVVVLGILHLILSPLSIELPGLAQVMGVLLASATSLFAYLIVMRITGNVFAAIGAGLIIAIDPTFAFAKVSGAEVALFTAVSFGAMWAFIEGKQTITGILTGLVVLARPEGIILAALLFAAFVAKRLWEREDTNLTTSDLQELLILTAPAIIAIAAWIGYNLTVSGLPLPNSFYVKNDSLGLFNAGNLAAIWTGYLRNTSYFVNIQPLVTIPLAGAGAYYAIRSAGFQSIALFIFPLLLIYGFSVFISLPEDEWNISARRYLDPMLPFLIVLLVMGATLAWEAMSDYIGSQSNLDVDSQSALRWTQLAGVAVLVIVSVAAIPFRWPTLATEFSDNTFNVANGPASVARWLDENIPSGATIATANPGALNFFSEHSLIDLTGLNYHEGIGEGIFVTSQIAKADYVVAFDGLYVRSWPFWDPTTFVDIEDNTILEGRRLVVYETAEFVDSAAKELPHNTSMERLVQTDSLDVGNTEDERIHNWQMVPLDNTLERTFRTNATASITDDARITSGEESFRVRTVSGRELVIVKRYDAGVRGVVQVFLNDEQVGVWRLAPRAYFFGEDQFFIPSSFIQSDTVELKFVHVPDDKKQTSLNSFYYWFFTTREGQ